MLIIEFFIYFLFFKTNYAVLSLLNQKSMVFMLEAVASSLCWKAEHECCC